MTRNVKCEAKRRLRWAVKWGHARDALSREYKRITRRAKRHHDSHKRAKLLDLLSSNNPEVYNSLRKKKTKQITPINRENWSTYLTSYFGGQVPNRVEERWLGPHQVVLDENRNPPDQIALGRNRIFTTPHKSTLELQVKRIVGN